MDDQFTQEYWNREIREAIETSEPSLCNRRITLVHFKLSRILQAVTGPDAGANFHTWAVWGSRKAGVTIRQEDLGEALRNATVVSGVVGLLVGLFVSSISIRLWLTGLHWTIVPVSGLFGMVCGALTGRRIATYSRSEAARLILEGNRIVLEDIGKQTARFVDMFHAERDPNPKLLEQFTEQLRPGRTEKGGQDLLIKAFSNYYAARYAADLKQPRRAAGS